MLLALALGTPRPPTRHPRRIRWNARRPTSSMTRQLTERERVEAIRP